MCDSGTFDQKVKVFKVSRPDLGNQWCIFRTGEAIADAELSDSEIGDKLVIEVIEMTEQQVMDLPEFEGW